MKKYSFKIVIGESDYSRVQMENDECGDGFGTSSKYFLEVIKTFEDAGFTVVFKTNIFRLIFALGTYKVIAYK
jgi:hypothetical protein